MEKEKEGILVKSRSARACIADGFRLYMENFRRIFRYTWVAALLVAIINGLIEAFNVNEYPRLFIAMQTGSGNTMQLIYGISSIMAAGSFLVLVAYMLFFSYGVSMLYHHSLTAAMPVAKRMLHIDGAMTWRMFKAMLWTMLISLVASLVVGIALVAGRLWLSPIVTVALTTVTALLVAVFLLPVVYVLPKYLLNPKLHFASTFTVAYVTGMRRWGFLFAVVLVTGLVCAIAWLLTSLPAIILYVANLQAQTGLLNGDPLGMPDHITGLTIGIFILASFLQAYIYLSALFPLYYAYGNLEFED